LDYKALVVGTKCFIILLGLKRLPPSPTFPPLALAMESNSSKNRTHGAALRAWGKKLEPYILPVSHHVSQKFKIVEN